ncbi:MAG: alanine racemase [Actinobacteria bacterium]|nr:alanine racemase [Actinomycetota bacterium]
MTASFPEQQPASRRIRPTWVEVDLGAIRENVVELARIAAPARLLTVVKADGYGHGAVPVARAALDAGAWGLGVALVEEGTTLRAAGIDAPVLVLSEPPPAAAPVVVSAGLTPTVYTTGGIDALAKAVADAGAGPFEVHLKVDTGMHRVGAAPGEALALARRVAEHAELRLDALWTHLAIADESDDPYTHAQLARFDAVLAALDEAGLRPPLVHAANSAGLLAFPESRRDLVRAGIAAYGIPPAPAMSECARLRPALSLKARVTHVKELPAGARLSYGLRYSLTTPSWIATVPIGYADGVPRRLAAAGGEVLLRGRRRRIAGTITMDQLMVDMGGDPVAVGDEVVLIGRQDGECVTAEEWAERLDTIAYEIVCGIGGRVPRTYLDG